MSKKKTIGKQLLSFTIQQKHGLSASLADGIIDTIFDSIGQALIDGNSVNILNVGSLYAVTREIGKERKAFGKSITTKKGVHIRTVTSQSFVTNFERKGVDKELSAFRDSLK